MKERLVDEIMINSKLKPKKLAITTLLLFAIGITCGCAAKISTHEKNIETYVL